MKAGDFKKKVLRRLRGLLSEVSKSRRANAKKADDLEGRPPELAAQDACDEAQEDCLKIAISNIEALKIPKEQLKKRAARLAETKAKKEALAKRPNREPAFTLRVQLFKPEYDDRKIIIRVWDGTRHVCGGERLDVEVMHGGEVIFAFGDTYCGLPAIGGVSTDGIIAREFVMALVGMKPGDTDADYFSGYTPRQLEWVEKYGEAISSERSARYCNPETGYVRRGK